MDARLIRQPNTLKVASSILAGCMSPCRLHFPSSARQHMSCSHSSDSENTMRPPLVDNVSCPMAARKLVRKLSPGRRPSNM